MNERYQRHIQLAEIGLEGQKKLSQARILVVGAGGLGCPILQYLTASGVGQIGIVDFDVVSLSNLHRQILYTDADIGKNKALCAQKKLQGMNPAVSVKAYPFRLTLENYRETLSDYEVIMDGTDNFQTRYLISDACVLLNKPMVFGALYKFEGQVSVFNYQNGPTYRCLFPKPPKAGEVPNCNEIGVLGLLPGIIGMFQAMEALKIVLNLGSILNGKILYYNVLDHRQQLLSFQRNEKEIQKIKDRATPEVLEDAPCEILILSLQQINSPKDYIWIDVREVGESPKITAPFPLIHVPLSEKEKFASLQKETRPKIFFCQSGVRSQSAVQVAQSCGVTQCYSLQEGAETVRYWIKKHYEREAD